MIGLGMIRKMSAGPALAVVSYLIYAYLALTLPQVVDNPFICERSSLAAAVSNVTFGMRVGTLDSEVMAYYLKTLDEPLRESSTKRRPPPRNIATGPLRVRW